MMKVGLMVLFLIILEKKYWNKLFTLDYDDGSECFTIYEIEIPEYKLKQQ